MTIRNPQQKAIDFDFKRFYNILIKLTKIHLY